MRCRRCLHALPPERVCRRRTSVARFPMPFVRPRVWNKMQQIYKMFDVFRKDGKLMLCVENLTRCLCTHGPGVSGNAQHAACILGEFVGFTWGFFCLAQSLKYYRCVQNSSIEFTLSKQNTFGRSDNSNNSTWIEVAANDTASPEQTLTWHCD